ncbi:putative protein OS=Streptomyces griseomycini OX=66895 GN=FHS37_002306 PE=4 SV=1 [Streptomyces griseomycini]|uniref:Uncharacterized protein n=1 Tax=Streptomyces griseomycini TaxID=66895 RepID=A0A7W7LZ50_9ACTN|nr:hypothetical protein [Streptomyces griseomycini]MBB4898271.1 hypothetical protein [Streptomyces griseomycini]GGR45357.1 hypothetical protein GCM10015536_58910 [Streptomyces griseomycini]
MHKGTHPPHGPVALRGRAAGHPFRTGTARVPDAAGRRERLGRRYDEREAS